MEEAFVFSRDAIHVTDADGNIIRVNPAFLELYRYEDPDEVVGRPMGILWTARWSPQYESLLSQIAQGKHWRGELPARTGDGSEVLARISAHPLGTLGAFEGGIFFSRDRTSQSLMEKQLLQAGKLAVLGSLAHGLAQEMNVPMTNLMLDAEYIRDGLSAAPAWRRNKMASDAVNSVVSAAGRVRRILRHSYLNGEKYPLTGSSKLPLLELIQDSLLLVENRLAISRIRIDLECQSGLHLIGNRAQFESVFHILFMNSREAFAGKEGPRWIRIRAAPDPESRKLTVEYRDNAGGIPPEVLAHIFEPFFTTKSGSSAGLGLSICEQIIKNAGGAIRCEPEGSETVFKITLPMGNAGRGGTSGLP